MSSEDSIGDGATPRAPIRAAQYVRMSTEHQKYSTENQAEIIAQYAARRGFEIVKTYEDSGKSGLRLDGRLSLQQLIADVRGGQTEFKAILVYDVSRWGRFQDADESAYYEFICREAGITVQYCAEQFENDGSLSATIIKSMKRAMAGEYSRELSVKVFTGQCRLIRLGFRQGGAAGFGLRRYLVDEHRHPKAVLNHGEQKSLQTDRVILKPGPPEEVEVVRRLYRMFVVQRRTETEIANVLNEEGTLTDLGRPWTRGTVHQVLTNEKYIGNNVYNRASFKLKAKRVVNTPDMWVRGDGAFEAIVERDFFDAAQRIIQERSRRFTDEELLSRLSALLANKGWLSGLVIDEIEDMPSSSTFRHRFGSLVRAYKLVGYAPSRDYRYIETNRRLRELHPDVVAQVVADITEAGGAVRRDPLTDLLHINEEFSASLAISRCHETSVGSLRWKVRFDSGLRPSITIVARMEPDNLAIRDYYLLPWLDFGTASNLRLAPENGILLDAYRFDTLDALHDLAALATQGGGMTEPTPEIRSVQIGLITILNPRVRNKRIFQELVNSIAHLGLKKPITVSQRPGKARFDLVCGQGRLEAFIALGQTEIPAIVIDAVEEDCFVMSLVENLARRQHSPLELVHAIGALHARGYSYAEIATKVDFSVEYVSAICLLLENGEEKLIAAVERGVIPHTIAMEIARAKDGEVQRALAEAYEEKTIPGNQVLAIRKIIDQRNTSGKQLHKQGSRPGRTQKPVTSEGLIRAYQRETERQKILIKRASLARSRLLFVANAMRRLLADEHFATLLRAEGLSTLPRALAERIEPA